MSTALIGHTGFVGSNLKRDGSHTDFFNSSNFREMEGREFDEVVCSGIPAVKWLANKEPDKDLEAISALLAVLDTVTTRRFVLISTVDVYPDPSSGENEDAVLADRSNHAYGRHREAVEAYVRRRGGDHLIARLPALFGPGLKKNVLFDLMRSNETVKINPAASFQWYSLERLQKDLDTACDAGIATVNLCPEPILTSRIVEDFFPDAVVGPPVLPAPSYRVTTKHAATFGGSDGFIAGADAVMDDMAAYLVNYSIINDRASA